MAVTINIILIGIGLLIILSIILSKASTLIGIPTLVVFLIIGMFLGSDGPVGIYFANYQLVQNLSIFALIIIMFSSGLDTNIVKTRRIAGRGIIIATLGVLITAIVVGLFIHLLLGLNLMFSLLIGAIISPTDAAAVFSIFEPLKIRLKNEIDSILELESATNDPMAYVLTTSFIYMILHPSTSILGMTLVLIQSLIFGAIIGYLSGRLSVKLINKINLDYEGLYPVLLIGIAVTTFAISEIIGGNGFLAVFITSLLIGSSTIVSKQVQSNFFDGLAWLMQIIMFVILGLVVFPSQLIPTMGLGLLIALGLIFIARPIATFICLIHSRFNKKEKVFISWVGIKGAVPIVFATYPLVSNVPQANLIFNVVFFITIISVLLQGTTIKVLAKKLNLIEEPI